jgi:uncharacterized NAD(P)/FAD-binding protein YdhS
MRVQWQGSPGVSAPTVAIVGGGCAGTLVAANLLRGAESALRVVIVERSARMGPGVAYATGDQDHLLNVPAERMSAFRDTPSHFASWAAGRLSEIAPASYLPRRLYGEYLEDLLAQCAVDAMPGCALELIGDEATGLRLTNGRMELRLAHRAPLICDRLVLATGPLGAAPIADLPDDDRIVSDPWAAGALAPPGPGGLSLVIGTGLSGVDAALSLERGGRSVVLLSRGGSVPHAHLPGLRVPAPAPSPPQEKMSLSAVEKMLRKHVGEMQQLGYDWRDALDGLRPIAQRLWSVLPPRQRRRFLRERRREWDARRHRMAPEVGVRLHHLLASERGQRLDGRALSFSSTRAGVEVEIASTRSGDRRRLLCQKVVLCTGPGMYVRDAAGPLLAGLLARGMASTDVLGLGLRATADGALLDAHGVADGRVLTLGALRRGELWETTAVEEIRAQAERVAHTISRSLHQPELALQESAA